MFTVERNFGFVRENISFWAMKDVIYKYLWTKRINLWFEIIFCIEYDN